MLSREGTTAVKSTMKTVEEEIKKLSASREEIDQKIAALMDYQNASATLLGRGSKKKEETVTKPGTSSKDRVPRGMTEDAIRAVLLHESYGLNTGGLTEMVQDYLDLRGHKASGTAIMVVVRRGLKKGAYRKDGQLYYLTDAPPPVEQVANGDDVEESPTVNPLTGYIEADGTDGTAEEKSDETPSTVEQEHLSFGQDA
jgi:hypothetical protein